MQMRTKIAASAVALVLGVEVLVVGCNGGSGNCDSAPAVRTEAPEFDTVAYDKPRPRGRSGKSGRVGSGSSKSKHSGSGHSSKRKRHGVDFDDDCDDD